jgi:hypothetical protein
MISFHLVSIYDFLRGQSFSSGSLTARKRIALGGSRLRAFREVLPDWNASSGLFFAFHFFLLVIITPILNDKLASGIDKPPGNWSSLSAVLFCPHRHVITQT